jgi:hypothetical protein
MYNVHRICILTITIKKFMNIYYSGIKRHLIKKAIATTIKMTRLEISTSCFEEETASILPFFDLVSAISFRMIQLKKNKTQRL